MGANSAVRKVAKPILYPLINEKTYKYGQAASKTWDIKKGSWKELELDLVKIGLREGETALDIGGRSNNREGKETQVRSASTKSVEAEVIRLDDFLLEIDDLPFVKIDVEGAEYFAF